ncbi:MAG: protein translocase subunit SecD, partial [Planctomycetota bacterium]
PAEESPTEPAVEETTAEPDAPEPVAEPLAGEGEPEAEPAEGEAGAELIESWGARTVFNLACLALFLAVLIGPFYLGKRLTKGWRQPLWAWPIAVVGLGLAAAVVIYLGRLVLGPLDPVFGKQFDQYVDVLAGLRNLWVAVALVAVPAWLGAYLSRKWRMPDYSGRIAVVFFAIFAGLAITIMGWPPKRGIDLSGGVILVYEFEDENQPGAAPAGKGTGEEGEGEEEAADDAFQARQFDMDRLIQAIRRRVDPSNVRELTIREYGNKQIEIIIPEADEEELERIKGKISSAGTLEFRILANQRDHKPLIDRALAAENARELYEVDPEGNRVLDAKGRPKLQARWVRAAKGEEEQLLGFSGSAETVHRKRTYRDYEWTEFLIVIDVFNVNGGYLVNSRPGMDQSARPSVLFTFNQTGGNLFGALTGKNLPNEADGFNRHLGIILDGYLQSAPSIRSTIFQRGEITGDFTRQEVEDMVDILNAGSLPTALSEEPISEMYRGPGLGRDTIERGSIAIVVSMLLVLAFMLVYYRFAGIVACAALLMNLVLILAVMISIKAAFTLPGLAGLVLTVGMAVDANVLIFERIREELSRQAALRMAIRNGFARATTTIIDANLTTLIVATVLYVIGTDQIKGFAVILWLGVVLSMFTAIYCSRLVFDVADRQKWITRLGMLQMLGKTQIDFLGMRRLGAAASIGVIVIGLGAVVFRGSGLLDIDFTGGVSIQVVFNESQDITDVRTKLGEDGAGLEDLAVSDVRALNQTESGHEFMINTSGTRELKPGPDVDSDKVLDEIKNQLKNTFGDELAPHALTVTLLPPEADAANPGEEPASNGAADSAVFAKSTRAKLEFEHKASYERLAETFAGKIAELTREDKLPQGTVDAQLFTDDALLTVDPEAVRDTWFVKLNLPQEKAQLLLSAVEAQFESEPYFPSSNTIGAQVAGKTRVDAVMALLASLVFIVGYIWIRFQRVMFGLAAVIALVHDVMITLGVIALTAYLAPVLGFLLIDEFKIGLPVLAAFLTIIGYSLNDTIVVFDRIREVRGKSPGFTEEMINTSINQTLSRTLLTSLTTLIVVVVLYIGGGQGIHVFAFALVVGVVVGTYSSIFVASPALFWMASASASAQKRKPAARRA